MKLYFVSWHTKPSPGSTYYDGVKRLYADDADNAKDRAQREVHRSFREYSVGHIVIDGVSDHAPVRETEDGR